ncbi:hypothetical protein N9T42_02990 [SAR86 cluster bacterium]|nr:hypothetical protein [SAR86 cluster bacterium]
MKKIILPLIIFGIMSCAAKPSSIQPALVSKLPYVSLSCDALKVSMDRETDNLNTLSGDQTSQRNWDIALNILLLPGVGAATSDSEELIAQSKGRLIVMQDEFVDRCSKRKD